MPAKRPLEKGRLRLPAGAGKAGEAAAEAHLRSLGYETVERNYRAGGGEIDIVSRRSDMLVFLEVKTRRTSVGVFGRPEESLTTSKKLRLIAAAQTYLSEHGLERSDRRIDLIAVELDGVGHVLRVAVFENAVGENGY